MVGKVNFLRDDNGVVKDAVLSFANPCLAEFFGTSVDKVEGSSALALGFPELVFNIWVAECQHSKETGKAVQFSTSLPPIHGQCKRDYWNCAKIITDDEYVFISQDITDVKELEQKLAKSKEVLEEQVKERTKALETALQFKSRFLANMSHEMRTPLSGIIGTLSLLSEGVLTSEQKEHLAVANICSQQLQVVINDILDLSKLEQGKMELEKLQFSLFQVVQESMNVIAIEADKKGIELIVDIQPPMDYLVIGDINRLRQILVNLLSNAVKFSDSGVIRLIARVSQDQDLIQFSIKDQGIGIPECVRSSLFQPFQQADSSMSRKYGGTGLGLSISQRLVHLMNGEIWFESEVNKGTTFHFTVKTTVTENPICVLPPCTVGKSATIITLHPSLKEVIANYLDYWHLSVIDTPLDQGVHPDIIICDAELYPTIANTDSEVILIGQKRMDPNVKHTWIPRPCCPGKLIEAFHSKFNQAEGYISSRKPPPLRRSKMPVKPQGWSWKGCTSIISTRRTSPGIAPSTSKGPLR